MPTLPVSPHRVFHSSKESAKRRPEGISRCRPAPHSPFAQASASDRSVESNTSLPSSRLFAASIRIAARSCGSSGRCGYLAPVGIGNRHETAVLDRPRCGRQRRTGDFQPSLSTISQFGEKRSTGSTKATPPSAWAIGSWSASVDRDLGNFTISRPTAQSRMTVPASSLNSWPS